MYNIKVDCIEFIGCEDDCWKFLYGFLGLSHRDYAYSELLDVDGAYSSYGTVVITEVGL